MTSTTLSTANVGPNSLADNVLTKQSASGFGFTGSAEDESERKDNDTTPPLTTDNDADLRAGSNSKYQMLQHCLFTVFAMKLWGWE